MPHTVRRMIARRAGLLLALGLLTSAAHVDTSAQTAPAGQAHPPAAFADPDRRTKLATAFPQIDALVQAFMARTHVPGAAWGIVIDGELAHVGVAGFRDLADKDPGDEGLGLSHRVDDEELHRDGDPEAA